MSPCLASNRLVSQPPSLLKPMLSMACSATPLRGSGCSGPGAAVVADLAIHLPKRAFGELGRHAQEACDDHPEHRARPANRPRGAGTGARLGLESRAHHIGRLALQALGNLRRGIPSWAPVANVSRSAPYGFSAGQTTPIYK
mgnify:CR=1 FL=1